jgi:hypothetical protein
MRGPLDLWGVRPLTSQAARFPGVLSAASTVAEAICVGVPEDLSRNYCCVSCQLSVDVVVMT